MGIESAFRLKSKSRRLAGGTFPVLAVAARGSGTEKAASASGLHCLNRLLFCNPIDGQQTGEYVHEEGDPKYQQNFPEAEGEDRYSDIKAGAQIRIDDAAENACDDAGTLANPIVNI